MSKIKADDYGDILALKYDGEKVYFSEDGGSYQGEYVAVIKSSVKLGWNDTETPQYYVLTGSYGSCSGCDWLKDERDWNDDTVDAAKALEYAEQSKPLYILPDMPTQEWVDALARKINQ